MAKPRIFVSSTYYDFKHIRSSLELFIRNMGYDPILSENGNIAYVSDMPLDESCYKEANLADMLILIIGGRYGSEVSNARKIGGGDDKDFYSHYESVTKKEFETAFSANIPIYILIQSDVYSEYKTYVNNEENNTICYAHVESINVFKFIKDVLTKAKNNPTLSFERFSQIESWLKEQWAGLFRDYLQSKSENKKLENMNNQIIELRNINQTLKSYMEEIIKSVSKSESISDKIIEEENIKLNNQNNSVLLQSDPWFKYLAEMTHCNENEYEEMMKNAHNCESLANIIFSKMDGNREIKYSATDTAEQIKRKLMEKGDSLRLLNISRGILGVPPIID